MTVPTYPPLLSGR